MRRRDVIAAGLGATLAGMPALGAPAGDELVYIGTQGDAILSARLDRRTGKLTLVGPVAKVDRPTWLTVDPARPMLYSVSETGNDGKAQGGVVSFAIDPATGALTPRGRANSGGGGATFLSYDPRARAVFVANFGGGQVAAIPVAADGGLALPASIVTDEGTGPTPNQRIPHAHAAILDPGGRFVVTPDMGADRVFVYRFDAATRALSPAATPFTATGPATGPRHLVFSPDGRFVYVLTELSAEVRVFRWNGLAGALTPVQTLAIDPPDFTGTKSAAEIVVSRDGRFLYASSRARSRIVVFAIDRASGTLRQAQDVPSRGETPRSFAIDRSGRWLVAGNQNSNTVVVFAIDPTRGTLAPVGEPVPVPMKPVAFAFYG